MSVTPLQTHLAAASALLAAQDHLAATTLKTRAWLVSQGLPDREVLYIHGSWRLDADGVFVETVHAGKWIPSNTRFLLVSDGVGIGEGTLHHYHGGQSVVTELYDARMRCPQAGT